MIHLTTDEQFQINLDYQNEKSMHTEKWFVLPPVQEYYFKSKNLNYRPLPPTRNDCNNGSSLMAMDILYPKPGASIFIPREVDGSPGKALFQLAHRSSSSTVYWHLDGTYLGSNKKTHHFSLSTGFGEHSLTVVDDMGEILTQTFEVLSNP